MLTILKFTLLIVYLLLLSVLQIVLTPFVAINAACSYAAIKIVSSLYATTNQIKKE